MLYTISRAKEGADCVKACVRLVEYRQLLSAGRSRLGGTLCLLKVDPPGRPRPNEMQGHATVQSRVYTSYAVIRRPYCVNKSYADWRVIDLYPMRRSPCVFTQNYAVAIGVPFQKDGFILYPA